MNEIIKPLLELFNNPLTDFFQWMGFSENLSKTFSTAFIAFLLWSIGSGSKKLYQRYKNGNIASDLVHFRFSYKDVRQKRELFIPTQGQNNSPAYEEEPRHGTKFIVKKPLIPFFIKTAFNEKKESDKFYLILADSGMGKTTFMINLYLRYHAFCNFRRKYKMKLFPFGDPDILKWIHEIQPDEARDTILLLDAFDECKSLLPPEKSDGLTDDERFRKVLEEIIESVKNFREIVITSRTQYFPGQEDQPYELKIPRYGSGGFHTLAKLYLSPFEEKEIRHYLNKKYGIFRFWNWQKKQTAASIVKNSPKLMVRPMLLSYIDYLVDDSRQNYTTAYQIYETLIQKWIEREAEKRKYKSEDREKFKKDLYAFSRFVALEIYEMQEPNNWLSKDQAIAICDKNHLNLRGYEITGQSLLTRDASQNWKFVHKSILEFFLAKEAVENIQWWLKLAKANFAGMDMAKLFYQEIGDWIWVKGGKFKMGDEQGDLPNGSQPVHTVSVSDFYIGRTPVTQKQWREVMGNNPSQFKAGDDYPVENLSWDDVQQFIQKLTAQTGLKFRLPSEAEWEYAARGGHLAPLEDGIHIGQFKYAGSNHLAEVGWYNQNSGRKTHPVASKKPNELGLYDMSGNVWEWCQDQWHDNYEGAPTDGRAWETGAGSNRVNRGGGWGSLAQNCRSARRGNRRPDFRYDIIGFRLVFVPQSVGR